VAAIVAGAQILGGVAAPQIRRLFHRRTSALIAMAGASVLTLGAIGIVESFWAVIGLISVWGMLFAATMPIRQAYLNDLIPSRQRATILSMDSLMASSGGVWTQPALGRAADAWGYAPTYLLGATISTLALPFLALSRRQNAPADTPTAPARMRAAPPGCLTSRRRRSACKGVVWVDPGANIVLDRHDQGAGAMTDHEERPPSALAHGPVKSDDIERVRGDVDQSGARVAHEKKLSAARRERELRRKAERTQDTER
jgi:MFS family permease